VTEFVHLAYHHGLPRAATVQNPYALVNRTLDTGLDEVLLRSGVSLLAYSPGDAEVCCQSGASGLGRTGLCTTRARWPGARRLSTAARWTRIGPGGGDKHRWRSQAIKGRT